jgi:hypothetical protein
MKRVLILTVVIGLSLCLSACQHWVGISTDELVKRLGPPINVVPSGNLSIYTYFDGLGGAPMRFYVDKDGIVRKWEATPVPTEFGTSDETVIGGPPTIP